MELVIILAVVAFGVWYFFLRDKELIKEATSEAPYKVDVPPVSEPVVQEVVVVKAPEPVVETPVVAEAPAKPKRAPRPKAETATAKAKAPAKAPAKTKTPAKPRVKAPKMTIAK